MAQQIINRKGTLKLKVFGIIDFTAGYHQTSLNPDSQEYTVFITQYGLFEWNRAHQLAYEFLSAFPLNACEVVRDYKEGAIYLHLSQSSLAQQLLVLYGL